MTRNDEGICSPSVTQLSLTSTLNELGFLLNKEPVDGPYFLYFFIGLNLEYINFGLISLAHEKGSLPIIGAYI